MRLEKFRKQLIICGFIFVLAGFTTSLIGFRLGGSNLSSLEEHGKPKWYRTIHVEDGRIWFGMEIIEGFYIMRF